VSFLLAVSRAIDALNRAVGHTVYWLILAAVLYFTYSARNSRLEKDPLIVESLEAAA